ncbi:MAG: hypothetical protein WA383_22260, partial [Terriglobales bacterium]
VGETGDLSTRFDDHHKADCFAQHNANCICTHGDEDEESRLAKTARLARIAAMIPITRLRPSSIGRVYNISLFVRHRKRAASRS